MLDDLALSGVDRVERGLGKRAALRALVPVLDTLPPGRGRARGILRGVRYAAELEDAAALDMLTLRWSVEPDARAPDARHAIVELLSAGRFEGARALADAEVARTRGEYDEAAAYYALGRCHEALGRFDAALGDHRMAAHLASEQPRLRQMARAREVRALVALGRRAEAGSIAAGLLPLDRGEPEDRLAVAVAALDAPGRYRRAAALDVLEALARTSGPVKREAIRAAARHAEQLGAMLSSIEADRIEAALKHQGETSRGRALACLGALAAIAEGAQDAVARAAGTDGSAEALLARARAVAEGNAAGPRVDDPPRARVGWIALAAMAALSARDRREARERLRELAELVRQGARLEAPAWTVALRALSDERLAAEGRALAGALLARDGEPPPRGFVALAEALDGIAPELATEAWRRAAARREPGARERLCALLRHAGWSAAGAGQREAAIALLREARRLAGAES